MKVAFHTLGCKVNQYETEALKERFSLKGYSVVDEKEFADIYVINTCTVTSLADRKSRQYIRKMKKVNPASIVAVTGCYAQIRPDEVASIEEVNLVAGTNEKGRLVEYIEEYILMDSKFTECHVRLYEELTEYEETGIITSMEGKTRAYIKIQEGCNRFCSYCIIPYARGPVRSRALGEIIELLRSFDKSYGITTDIIAGFPGETEEDFVDSLEIIQEAGFCKVHAFKYSKREGTAAAGMKLPVSPEMKNRRSERLIAEGKKSVEEFFRGCIGETRVVLTENIENGMITGYTDNYVKAYIDSNDNELLNKFIKVKITGLYKDGVIGLIKDGVKGE